MDKIKTASGFEYCIEPDALDDLDVFELIKKSNAPDLPAMEKIDALFQAFRLIIGEEQDKALRDYLREKTGKLKTSEYRSEVEQVFSGLSNSKKK